MRYGILESEGALVGLATPQSPGKPWHACATNISPVERPQT